MIVVTAPTSSIGRQVLEHLLDSDGAYPRDRTRSAAPVRPDA